MLASMAEVAVNGVRLFYKERGTGEETVVLSHSFLLDHRHFAPQIEALSQRYRVIAYDHRDHGQSELGSGNYGIYDLMDDGIGVIEKLATPPVHWVGLSTGGFVGMRIAFRRPDLINRLVLMDTSAGAEPALKRLKYQGLIGLLRLAGIGAVKGTALGTLFSKRFLREQHEWRETWDQHIAGLNPAAVIRFGNAIWSRDDVIPKLADVRAPTLVMCGAQDRALPPSVARATAQAIPGAAYEEIPDAGHISTLEAPGLVSDKLLAFLG